MAPQSETFYTSASRYRMLVENSCDIIFALSLNGDFTFVSPACKAVLGYNAAVVLGHNYREFVHPDDCAGCQSAIAAAFSTGQPAEYSYRIRHADGSWRWHSSKGAPHRDEAGTLTIIGIARDITELKQAAAWQEQFKSSLSAILNSLPSIIVTVNREGEIDLTNSSFEQFSGLAAQDARGIPLAAVLPQFREQLQQVAQAIDRRQPVSFEMIQHRSVTACRYFSLYIYPLTVELSAMAVVRIEDISDHVRIEEIMVQTEKMSMVGSMAAGMAHEINNPLGAIMQHAQNIERRVSADIAANQAAAEQVGVSLELVRAYLEKRGIFDFIGHIRTAGMRAASIITDMLQFSRRGEARVEQVDLGQLLDRTLKLAASDYDMKKVYNFKDITLVRQYADDLPPVSMVVAEMEQVLLNIFKNAAQAMAGPWQSAAPQLTLQTGLRDGLVTIRLTDNGPGMYENTRLRIFEPFFSTKPVGVGTGLGLSVAYAIITKGHHGSIEVQSQPGAGSCFTITLPLSDSEVTGGLA